MRAQDRRRSPFHSLSSPQARTHTPTTHNTRTTLARFLSLVPLPFATYFFLLNRSQLSFRSLSHSLFLLFNFSSPSSSLYSQYGKQQATWFYLKDSRPITWIHWHYWTGGFACGPAAGGDNTDDWWRWWLSLSPEASLYMVFLSGSILSSLISIVMVLVTACRQQPHPKEMAITPPSAVEDQVIEGKRRSSVWLSRMGCLIFVGQISWALFGTHLLFFFDDHNDLPDSVRKSTTISVLILWLNYVILTAFSFILFCASFFILLGVRRRSGSRRPSIQPPSTTVGEEMQYHREETTPLLNSNRSL
ncbi:hypothetical protein BX666DRAFT_1886110 [Dichotomocladium elegans]|nr:hypothetical protein BX666DRAFT_1886110 [Dichotomocladium elegans]